MIVVINLKKNPKFPNFFVAIGRQTVNGSSIFGIHGDIGRQTVNGTKKNKKNFNCLSESRRQDESNARIFSFQKCSYEKYGHIKLDEKN